MRPAMLLVFLALALPTAALASTIPVTNPSFETHPALTTACAAAFPNCFFLNGNIPGWSRSTATAGQMQPGPLGPFLSVPNGSIIAWSNGATLSQTVGATVQAGATYLLTVDLGRRVDQPFTASAELLLGTEVCKATGTTPSAGHWSLFTAECAATPLEAGAPIRIELLAGGPQAGFDNVHLSEVPEPGALSLLGTGLIGLAGMLRRKPRLGT